MVTLKIPARWPGAFGRCVLPMIAALCCSGRCLAQGDALDGELPSDLYGLNDQFEPPKDDPVAGDPVVLYNGNFRLEETDLFVAGRGIDFTLTRTYRSGSVLPSALGAGWDFNWNQYIVLEFGPEPVDPNPGPGDGAGGDGYVGQSGNVWRRMREHARSRKLPQGNDASVTRVSGGKTARETAEQHRIDAQGGIKGGSLENKVNPIGPKRRHLLGGGQ